MGLEAITRQEQIIAGKDLKPVTRMEKFLKSYGGGGGGVLTVNITSTNTSGSELTADKTFEEIVAAIEADEVVQAVFGKSTKYPEVFPLTSWERASVGGDITFITFGKARCLFPAIIYECYDFTDEGTISHYRTDES